MDLVPEKALFLGARPTPPKYATLKMCNHIVLLQMENKVF